MFSAFYWAVNTLFTVGPGDIVPITSSGRIVSVATVVAGAVLIPLQLSEIVAATVQARNESNGNASRSSKETPNSLTKTPANSEADPTDGLTFVQQSLPPPLAASGIDKVHDDAFDYDAECRHCHLRVHQRDARFCRNCGAGLLQ